MTIHKTIQGEGQDVVLIHGWGLHSGHMQPIADYLLKKNYRVTNIDLPGRGLSDWSEKIETIDDMADVILPDLPEKAIYIVNSIGGPVSFSIAARFPERVERIIGVATSPKFIEDDNWPGVPKPGFLAGFKPLLEEVGMKGCLKEFYKAEFADVEPKPAAFKQVLALIDSSQAGDDAAFCKGLAIVDADDSRAKYQSLSCPVDLILGLNDGAVPAESFDHIKALKPEANVHKMPGGHVPFWTHPTEFYTKLDEILKA